MRANPPTRARRACRRCCRRTCSRWSPPSPWMGSFPTPPNIASNRRYSASMASASSLASRLSSSPSWWLMPAHFSNTSFRTGRTPWTRSGPSTAASAPARSSPRRLVEFLRGCYLDAVAHGLHAANHALRARTSWSPYPPTHHLARATSPRRARSVRPRLPPGVPTNAGEDTPARRRPRVDRSRPRSVDFVTFDFKARAELAVPSRSRANLSRDWWRSVDRNLLSCAGGRVPTHGTTARGRTDRSRPARSERRAVVLRGAHARPSLASLVAAASTRVSAASTAMALSSGVPPGASLARRTRPGVGSSRAPAPPPSPSSSPTLALAAVPSSPAASRATRARPRARALPTSRRFPRRHGRGRPRGWRRRSAVGVDRLVVRWLRRALSEPPRLRVGRERPRHRARVRRRRRPAGNLPLGASRGRARGVLASWWSDEIASGYTLITGNAEYELFLAILAFLWATSRPGVLRRGVRRVRGSARGSGGVAARSNPKSLKLGGRLGDGSFGQVFAAVDQATNQELVVKQAKSVTGAAELQNAEEYMNRRVRRALLVAGGCARYLGCYDVVEGAASPTLVWAYEGT